MRFGPREEFGLRVEPVEFDLIDRWTVFDISICEIGETPNVEAANEGT